MTIDHFKNSELQEKLKNVKNGEELVALAESEGYEFADEQLDSISGGN